MATVVMTDQDCAVLWKEQGSGRAYKIEGSSLSKLTSGSSQGSLILITDVVIEDVDIALPVVAADDVRVLFKFGKDFGSLTIVGRIFSGNAACGSHLIKDVEDAFNSARLAKTTNPTKVSIAGGKSYASYPIKLRFSDTQAATNSVGFSIQCIIAPD